MKKITTVPEIREAYERRNSVEVCREVVEELHDRLGVVLANNDDKDQQIAALERELEELKKERENDIIQPSNTKKRKAIKLHKGAFLTWDQVYEMRHEWLNGTTIYRLAKRFHVTQTHVRNIVKNRSRYDENYHPEDRKVPQEA